MGLSGSPIFNVNRSALCGMVVRGTMADDACTLWYVDIFDIFRLLDSVSERRASTSYFKTLGPPVEGQEPTCLMIAGPRPDSASQLAQAADRMLSQRVVPDLVEC